MGTLLRDVHLAFRLMRRSPWLTIIAVLSLALGIGANTAVFSLIDQLILKPLPVRHPEQLVVLGSGHSRGMSVGNQAGPWTLFSYAAFEVISDQNHVFSEVTALQSFPVEVAAGVSRTNRSFGTARQVVSAELVEQNYFSFMGVKAALGRTLVPADRNTPVAVLDYHAWKNKFAGEVGIVGKTVDLSGVGFTVVGVAPPQFFGDRVGEEPDLWIPLSLQAQLPPKIAWLHRPDVYALRVFARTKPGVTLSAAAADSTLILQRLLRQQAGSNPTPARQAEIREATVQVTAAPNGLSGLRDEYSGSLLFLMLTVAVVLLIACLNVGNLLLARGTGREREIAVRLALGASRSRLICQMLTESIVLAGLGGTAGVFFAQWADSLLIRYVSQETNTIFPAAKYDPGVLLFTLALSMFTGALFGIWPALRRTAISISSGLKDSGTAITRGRRLGPSNVFVGAQVSLAFLLLITAALFLRSLEKLRQVDVGFDYDHVAQLIVNPEAEGYHGEQLGAIYMSVLRAIDAVPGVRSSTMVEFPPLSGDERYGELDLTERPGGRDVLDVSENLVGPNFFHTMGIPLQLGRDFTEADDVSAPKIAAIDEDLAHFLFGNQNPIGRHLAFRGSNRNRDVSVVAVVHNTRYVSIRGTQAREVYEPVLQVPAFVHAIEVRSALPTRAIMEELRTAISKENRDFPVTNVTPLSTAVDRSLTREILVARLSGLFGLSALLLACIGLYGVMAYTVARRTVEIGIRMALGANRSDVLWMVLRQSMHMLLMGLVIGVPVAIMVTRLIAAELFGVSATDLGSYTAAAVILIATGASASYFPARRASRVDPILALRFE